MTLKSYGLGFLNIYENFHLKNHLLIYDWLIFNPRLYVYCPVKEVRISKIYKTADFGYVIGPQISPIR